MTTAPRREVDVLRRSLDLLIARLPSSWTNQVTEEAPIGARRADAVIDIVAPDGQRTKLIVEAKLLVEPKDVDSLAARLKELTVTLPNDAPAAAPVVVARYLSPPVRDRLTAAGIGYADATGNLCLSIERPALFLRDVGADRDPWRGPGRPRGTLKGATAARLVRALADFAPPYSVPDLAAKSGASVGATYRMIEFLEREDLIAREPRGPITRVDWRRLIERWSEDVGVGETDRMSLYLEPRGIPSLLTKLRTAGDLRYVLTGTFAARYYDELVPPRLAVIYADPVEPLIERLDLRPSPAGNVLVGVPIDSVVFERMTLEAALKVAAPSQVAVDLLGGPGRGPSEAAALLDWMERKPDDWRR